MQTSIASDSIEEIKKNLGFIENIAVLNLNTIETILDVGQYNEGYRTNSNLSIK